MLKLKLTRIARKKGYTIGRLLIQTCSRTRDRSRGRSYATRSNPVAQPQKGEVWNSLKTLNRLLAILQRRKKVLPLNARMNVITIQASKRLSKCSFLYRQTLSTLFTGSSFLMIQTKRWPSSNKIESSVASTTRTAYSRFCVPAPEFAHKHTGSPRARSGTHTLDSR